jgi:rhodanese-related sulfurtransferase
LCSRTATGTNAEAVGWLFSSKGALEGEMITKVGHEEVQQLLADGGQIIDVLPSAEYDEFHIRGAISLPLKDLRADSTEGLEKDRPTIVYCHDSL